MRILITGATGFTGSYVVPLLLEQGAHIRCFVRRSSDISSLPENHVELIYGNLDDIDSLKRALLGMDVLVNIASLGFGHAPNIIQASLSAGVKRAVLISTTAIFTTLNAPSKSVRLAAEESIRSSGLTYTILRPTMIYGSSRDRNMCRLIRYLQKWPIIPVLGNGNYMQQPVYVGDVARAVIDALSTDRTAGKVYNIAGAEAITYNDIISTVCQLLRCKVHKLHLPALPIVKVLQAMEVLGLQMPVRTEQILRLNEHKTFDFDNAHRDFSYTPFSFAEGISFELEEMGFPIE